MRVRSGDVVEVLTDGEPLIGDRYVLAAASYSAPLLRGTGIRLPVRPVKGYSITLNRQPGEQPLRLPIVDDDLHAVVTPLENRIRVAGTAEFTGYDLKMRPERIRNLTQLLRKLLPQLQFDDVSVQGWCGLRPMSCDGVPIVSATSVRNLFVSSGHGHLGWTMAAGSGELLAQLICEEPPSLDAAPYSITRFSAS